jgi:hypothetical protein
LQAWFDASLKQALPKRLRAGTSVALNGFGLEEESTSLASYLGNGMRQRFELRNVLAIRAGQENCGRDSLCVENSWCSLSNWRGPQLSGRFS